MKAHRQVQPALLLDVMSTLVVDPIFTTAPRLCGVDDPRALIGELDHDAWVAFETGDIDEPTYFRRWFRPGRDRGVDPAAFKAAMAEGYLWLDGVEPLLADLKIAGVEMHALSNYPPWYEIIEARLGLSRYLEWTFVSCRTGRRKPAPAAYLEAAAALGRAPGECLFVDDRRSNVAAAEALGMPALRFTDAATLRADLAARGLL